MFAAFLLLSFAASAGKMQFLICSAECPSGTSMRVIQNVESGTDMVGNFTYYSVDDNDIYFYTASRGEFDFIFPGSAFDGKKVRFYPYSGTTNFDIYIQIGDEDLSTETLEFEGVDVHFTRDESLSPVSLDLGRLKINNTQIKLENINDEMIVNSIEVDENILGVFSKITIQEPDLTASGLEYDIYADDDATALVGDSQIEIIHAGKSCLFVFSNSQHMNANFVMQGSSGNTLFVNYTGTTASRVPSLTFENLPSITFSGNWPTSAVFPVVYKRLDLTSLVITADSSVLPISRDDNLNTIIRVSDDLQITGDFDTNITFEYTRNTFKEQTQVTMLGTYTGENIDLGSSYIRLTLATLDTDFSSIDFPFTFRVGTGGASTVICNKVNTETILTNNKVYIKTDFDNYLTDDELSTLLETDVWDLLKLTDCPIFVNHVELELPNEPFIHGFIDGDSCMNIYINDDTIEMRATAPSTIPLLICYDGSETTCDEGRYGVEIHDITILNQYFVPGMKQMRLTMMVSVDQIDFSSFDVGYEDCTVYITGHSSSSTSLISISSISFGSQDGISLLKLTSLQFTGRTTFHVKNIEFKYCTAASSANIAFQNDDSVNGDDDFVKTFFSVVSGVIETFHYTMDLYDAISVDSDKYVFYDIDTNDLSDPISIPYDSIDKFTIIYDIGMTTTATENNLNVTMNTANPPSFNITFELIEHDYRTESELILYHWTQSKNADFQVYFDHGSFPVKIVLTEPYQPTQIIPVGDGTVTWVDRYGEAVEYCACNDRGSDDCATECPSDSSEIGFDEIQTKLNDTQYNSFTFYVYGTSAGQYPTVDLKYLNDKTVSFIGLSDQQKIVISNTNNIRADLETTTTTFTNMKFDEPTDTSETLSFGTLTFINTTFVDDYDKIDLQVGTIICNFTHFQQFKSVHVTDNCIVVGEPAQKESTVSFADDQNSQDLQVTLTDNARIIMGDGYIKIGSTTFQISRTRVYDIIISMLVNKQIEILKDSAATDNNIPRVLFRDFEYANVRFGTGWDQTSTDYIFLFNDVNETTITLQDTNTPIAISVSEGNFNLVADAPNVGINGFIEYKNHNLTHDLDIRKTTDPDVQTTITIGHMFDIGYAMNIVFKQPCLTLELYGLEGSSRYETSLLTVEHISNLVGDSKLVVKQPFDNIRISNNYTIDCSITEDITSESVQSYISADHVLFKVNSLDISKFKTQEPTFIGNPPTTHGFNGNMQVVPNSITLDVSLKFIVPPQEVPYEICYNARRTCEMIIDDSNSSDLNLHLPKNPKYLQFYFGSSNTNALRLDHSEFKNVNVLLQSTTPQENEVKATLGQNIISTLNLSNVELHPSDSSYEVGSLRLENGAKIDSLDGIDNLIIDYETWKEDNLQSYANPITIEYDDTSLHFTENGWKLSNDKEILYSNFPKFIVLFTSTSEVTFRADSGLSKVMPVTIISGNTNNKFNIDANFDTITSPVLNFSSRVLHNKMEVSTKSYPFLIFPTLMNAGTLKIDSSLLPYTSANKDIHFVNLSSVIDFQSNSNGKLYADKLTMMGTSNLNVENYQGDYPIELSEVDVHTHAFATLGHAKITNSLTVTTQSIFIGNSIDLPNAEVVLDWSLNAIPNITFYYGTTASLSEPKSIKIQYVGDSISGKEGEFNNFLYRKLHDVVMNLGNNACSSWCNKVTFSSTVPYFNDGDDLIFEVECNAGDLVIVGRKEIPYVPTPTPSDDDDSSGGLPGGAVAAIVIVVLVVVALCGLAVWYFIKKKGVRHYLSLLKTERMDSSAAAYTDNYTSI